MHYRQYKTRDEAMNDIAEYIEPFYNQRSSHSTLAYETPKRDLRLVLHRPVESTAQSGQLIFEVSI